MTITHDTCDVILSHTPFCIVSPKEKEKKKKRKVNINNDLAILPSHDIPSLWPVTHINGVSVTVAVWVSTDQKVLILFNISISLEYCNRAR